VALTYIIDLIIPRVASGSLFSYIPRHQTTPSYPTASPFQTWGNAFLGHMAIFSCKPIYSDLTLLSLRKCHTPECYLWDQLNCSRQPDNKSIFTHTVTTVYTRLFVLVGPVSFSEALLIVSAVHLPISPTQLNNFGVLLGAVDLLE